MLFIHAQLLPAQICFASSKCYCESMYLIFVFKPDIKGTVKLSWDVLLEATKFHTFSKNEFIGLSLSRHSVRCGSCSYV